MDKEVKTKQRVETSNGRTVEPSKHELDDDEDSAPESTQSPSVQDQKTRSWPHPSSTEVSALPSPADQRAIVERLDTAGAYAYAVSKRWMQRWQRFVGLDHRIPSDSFPGDVVQVVDHDEAVTPPPPGPVEMDCQSDDQNVFVDEGLWRRLVVWYGINTRHQLDRKNRFFEDRKPFEICVLNSFSGIVAHATKVLNRFEEIGYVEYQLRRIYDVGVNDHQRIQTRMWISERALVPRFQLLLNRTKMLNDFLDKGRDYILALEKKDPDDLFWPTGELGTPKGDLKRYDELLEGPRIQPSAFGEHHQGIEQYLQDSVKGIVETVGRAFSEEGEKRLQRERQQLEETEEELKVRERQILERRKAVDTRLKALSRRRRELESQEGILQSRSQRLDEMKKAIQVEKDFMERILESQNSRIVLDVGGEIFETSRTTMRKDRESLLAAMFAGDSNGAGGGGLVAEDDGSHFIDRDGSQFRFILEFLRDETSIANITNLEGASLRRLLREAQFYQLKQLVEHLEELSRLEKVRDDEPEHTCRLKLAPN